MRSPLALLALLLFQGTNAQLTQLESGIPDQMEQAMVEIDAAVTSIQQVPQLLCGEDRIQPRITLKNNGTLTLTSATITYGVSAVPQSVFPWSGSLQPGQTFNVDLPQITVPAGEHDLVATVSDPNGTTDQEPSNDSWTFPFTVNDPGGLITFALTLDDFGSDITWTLETALGTTLYQGGPYPDDDAGEVVQVPFCLTNDCYVFTIHDVFGDGICCTEGEGSYVIYDVDSLIYAESDGQYGFTNSNEFCVTVVGVQEQINSSDLLAYPNPTSGLLNVQHPEMAGPVFMELCDATGRVLRSWRPQATLAVLELTDLPDGMYLLSFRSSTGSAVKPIVLSR
ncbi:MAG: T9SS type A sorting domain-containing protein [Flavobacteriales bacterium]|nr:T9SS type A sorting domain-containing protein [Flavobacteriales bacterium]